MFVFSNSLLISLFSGFVKHRPGPRRTTDNHLGEPVSPRRRTGQHRKPVLQPCLSALRECIHYHTDNITGTIIQSFLFFSGILIIHPAPLTKHLGIALDPTLSFTLHLQPSSKFSWPHQNLSPALHFEGHHHHPHLSSPLTVLFTS